MPNHAIPARLQLRHITKQYPGCLANDAVDLTIQPGEIHALLGENGAGKSTLMKIIYGVTQPDAGSIIWQGQAQVMRNPAQARSLGIGMVFQHFSLFETLSVAQNIALAMGAAAGTPKQLEPRIREVSQRYGMAVEPQRLVHSLSIGERQKVEIIRCLMQDIRLLILDEPTSVLTPQEAEELFVTLRHLAEEGCSILFISHKLGEVRALCHSATVLRNGKVSGHCIPAECSDLTLARMMVGDAEGLTAHYEKVSGSAPFLRVDRLSWHNPDPFGCSLKNLSLEVRSGEIVGIAGVAGNGQDELLALLSGEQPLAHAQAAALHFAEAPVGHLRPDARRKRGLAFVPAERLGHGAVPELSLADNALLTAFQQGLVSNGLIQRGKVRALADEIIRRFAVKTPDAQAPARSLSG
ncbi:ABC transporter ATP-binding protein, partial [Pseudomonas syringae]